MTIEEAKRILHPDTSREAISEINEQNGFDHEKGIEKVKEACLVACEALEKQIPKKPVYVDTRFRHHGNRISDGCSLDKCYKCPNCISHIFHVFDSENYCKYCGQHIDWSEE